MAKHTIKLKDYSKVFEEYVAVAAITPGMLIEYTSAGKVQKHSSAGQNQIQMFALEDELQGKDIDDDYAAAAVVQVWIPGRGDQVYALLKDGENVSIGDLLESAGDGYLQKHTPDIESGGDNIYTNQIVGEAIEALDLSSSSGAETTQRFEIRIL